MQDYAEDVSDNMWRDVTKLEGRSMWGYEERSRKRFFSLFFLNLTFFLSRIRVFFRGFLNLTIFLSQKRVSFFFFLKSFYDKFPTQSLTKENQYDAPLLPVSNTIENNYKSLCC